jgi:hypothetical protein
VIGKKSLEKIYKKEATESTALKGKTTACIDCFRWERTMVEHHRSVPEEI